MKLSTYLKLKGRGSISELARAIGAHHPDVSDWATDKRPVPVGRCVAIERVTGGAVTRRDLRDDWAAIWPELAAEKAGAA